MRGIDCGQLVAVIVIGITLISSSSAKTAEFLQRATERCSININQDLGEPQPLFIRPGTSEFVHPQTSAGIIQVNREASIELFCSHGFRAPFRGRSLLATCVRGTTFRVNQQEVNFNRLDCTDLPRHTARKTNRKCPNGDIAEIGYPVGNRWLSLMEVCYDARLRSTHWVHHFQSPWNRAMQHGVPRIRFIQGKFFPGLQVQSLYTRERQRRTIGKILGSQALAAQLIEPKGDLFLARGHLAARSDYVFGSHQQGTFYFLNAAPQWQTFNGGNWERVEVGLRNYVDRRGWNVELYTGTHGILKLKDVNGVPREIFLDDSRGRRIPVPKIYYKVAIEKSRKAGIVFIGVNHPYATIEEIKKDFTFCTDISSKVTYIPWRKHSIRYGYSYACSVPEFAKRIAELPRLPPVEHLLL